MRTTRYRWWHGLAFYAGVQVASWALKASARKASGQRVAGDREGDRQFYRSERLPVFAPPTIAFPIAWSINCASTLAGGVHVLNLSRRSPGRADFLRSQVAAWALYACFEAAYFGLRSPINAAVVTALYTAATGSSFQAARRMRDPWGTISLLSTMAWLALANPVGIAQAAWNYDPFWKVGPLIEPPQGWAKETRRIAGASS